MFETMGSSLLMSKGKAASGPLVTCTLWWHVDMWLSLEAINKVRDREPVCRRILGQPSSRGGPRSRHHWFCWGLLLCPAVLPSCHHPCVCVSPSLSAPCKKSSVEACSLWPFSLSVLTVCFAAFCRKFSFCHLLGYSTAAGLRRWANDKVRRASSQARPSVAFALHPRSTYVALAT